METYPHAAVFYEVIGMAKGLFPDALEASTYDIPVERLYELGFRGMIFDIDNTLVEHGAPANERAIAFFARLKELGMDACLLSNNKEPRVKMFNEPIGVHYIYKAGKPGIANYKKAMEYMGTDETNTVFVGDQIFTDVWGANRAGVKSILVKPINPREEIQIVLKRVIEKPILVAYRLCGKHKVKFY